MTKACSSFLIFAALLVAGPSTARPDQSAGLQASSAQIESSSLRIEFDKNMRSRVVAKFDGKDVSVGAFSASETVRGDQRSWNDFVLSSQTRERISDTYGKGEKLTLTGLSGTLRKNLSVIIYDEFPNLAVFEVSYTNVGKSQLTIIGWNNNTYTIDAQRGTSNVPFWSFQSGSYERRPDWLVPLHTGFSQQNYLGMNASDYGGGTPIVDVWRKDVGIGVGHSSRDRVWFLCRFLCPTRVRRGLAFSIVVTSLCKPAKPCTHFARSSLFTTETTFRLCLPIAASC